MANSKKFKDPNTYFDAEGVHDFEKGKTQAEINSAFADNAGAHNCLYRGKSLGTSVTAEQWEAIANGTFKDLYIGDYWVINGITWRIAAFDYFYNSGDVVCTTHHAVIVPDTCLYKAKMNDSNTTASGYAGSAMYKSNLAQAKTTIKNAFGAAHVLTKREVLTTVVNGNVPSEWGWFSSEAELMNEVQAFGSVAWGAYSGIGRNVGSGECQFPLFMFDRTKLHDQEDYWLRDVSSATNFSMVNKGGYADSGNASAYFGVRTYCCICKASV